LSIFYTRREDTRGLDALSQVKDGTKGRADRGHLATGKMTDDTTETLGPDCGCVQGAPVNPARRHRLHGCGRPVPPDDDRVIR
jgi:hypothetical protein